MIFRVIDNKLYTVKVKIENEDEFIQKNGTLNFIKVDPSTLPTTDIVTDEVFYQLDSTTNTIIIDEIRTQQRAQEYFNIHVKALKDNIYNIRKQKENEGLIVNNTYVVDTSLAGRSNIQATLQAFSMSLLPSDSTINWKFLNGTFHNLTLNQLTEIAGFIFDYIEKLFDAEAYHYQNIDSLTNINAIMSYDLMSNWPSKEYTSSTL